MTDLTKSIVNALKVFRFVEAQFGNPGDPVPPFIIAGTPEHDHALFLAES